MMTWKEFKKEVEEQGLHDEIFVNWITIKADEKLIVKIDEHSIAEVSSY